VCESIHNVAMGYKFSIRGKGRKKVGRFAKHRKDRWRKAESGKMNHQDAKDAKEERKMCFGWKGRVFSRSHKDTEGRRCFGVCLRPSRFAASPIL